MPIDHQAVIRANRDTLYSGGGVFNLDVGPMTVTLPDVGKHFMSPEVFDEDEYVVEIASPGHLGLRCLPKCRNSGGNAGLMESAKRGAFAHSHRTATTRLY